MNTETNYATDFYSENLTGIALLEKNIADYPASSVARLMLLYHYKKTNNPHFEELAKQTGIYLNNPSWIQFQLNQISLEENKLEIVEPNKQILEENPPAEGEKEISSDEKKEQLLSNFNNGAEEKELPPNEILQELPEKIQESLNDLSKNETEPKSLDKIKNESLPISEVANKLPFDENKEELISDFKTNGAEKELPANEVLPKIPAQVSENNDETIATKPGVKDLPITEDQEVNFENQQMSEAKISEEPVEEKSVLDFKIPEEQAQKNDSETDNFSSETEEIEISFEPLHTVDYFASQGIKISEEDLANDHLGKQVKSFTAWLKSMKKLHPGQLPDQNEVVEKIIQSASETSNLDAHVLTEAMAEVLVKQNKQEKAIEMYQKLSLLNPSKSAYFAAKIESLKFV